MALPLIPIIISAVGGTALLALFATGSKPSPGDTVKSGSAENDYGTQFLWRVQYTLNEDAPYVVQVKIAGFGGPEAGWEFIDVASELDEAQQKALDHISQRPEGG